jgi:DNA-binding protein HU-beta
VNKAQLIQKISRDTGVRRTQAILGVKSLVNCIRDTIREGGKISLTGLGTFKVKARKARPGRNPKTGETISIPAGRKISFKPSLSLKKLVKG